MISRPLSVYVNWAAYDELSDSVELTEELAMKQLTELLRLRKTGIRFECYLMDAFWFEETGGYRTWRKPHWPHGPDRWLKECIDNGIKPGLWFSGNTLCKLKAGPEWIDSLDETYWGMCLFHGGFLPHWLETARIWYERGVRVFKLDFFQFAAAPPTIRRKFLASEIRTMNIAALRHGLGVLRDQCPEIVFLGYNGFDESDTATRTDIPFRKTVDPHWLEAFDSLYCGDPRPSDVPAMNFWRAKDVYSDHMIRVFQDNGFPLSRIDSSAFMIGTTGTCYFRKTEAWEGMLILSLARGNLVNTYYGNLDLLSNEQGAWFAKVQSLFFDFHTFGRFSTFGEMPGESRPYGYLAENANGTLITVVNPAQAMADVPLPFPSDGAKGRILFHDSGYLPILRDGCLRLGPEQMAVVGTGCYNAPEFDLGQQEQVRIPSFIETLSTTFLETGNQKLTAMLDAPKTGYVRIVLRLLDKNGKARRISGGYPPKGTAMGKLIGIEADQDGKPITVQINYDKMMWSGLSWAVGEINAGALLPGVPVNIRCFAKAPADVLLKADFYHTTYVDAHHDVHPV